MEEGEDRGEPVAAVADVGEDVVDVELAGDGAVVEFAFVGAPYAKDGDGWGVGWSATVDIVEVRGFGCACAREW